jgi:hypothetical protein
MFMMPSCPPNIRGYLGVAAMLQYALVSLKMKSVVFGAEKKFER